MRTIIKYPGAKWRIADWIISMMPEHHSYLEPFFGSGAVFFKKQPSHIETINDIDGDVFNLFDCVREDPERLARLVYATPYSRQRYDESFLSEPDNKYERALRTLVQHWQGHGFRTGAYKAGWKNDVAGRERAYAVRYWNLLPGWIMDVVERLKQAQIENMDAIKLIKRFNRENVLIYADPPYLLSTRQNKKIYGHEMSEAEHIDLLQTLKEHKGPVMLSGYMSDLYRNFLSDWKLYWKETTAEKGLHRTEYLWIKR